MTVILERPYEFVPPVRTPWWPTAIQAFRLIDWHLRRRESVLEYELRNEERFAESLAAGHGILLAPNHCRYADPIALGWLARRVRTHLYAMASWHLFNSSAFESFALRRMGGFSIYREGNDRQSLEMAIEILATAERPLVLFPEGTTNRTNDVLKPLLEGVSFVARMAAKKRARESDSQVVMHPIGMKYLCLKDPRPWVHQQLIGLEKSLYFEPAHHASGPLEMLARLRRIAEGFLSLKEVEHVGASAAGDLATRRDRLMIELLHQCELKYELAATADEGVRDRVRKIRSAIAARHFGLATDQQDLKAARRDAEKADLAQFLLSFPDQNMDPDQLTETQVIETVQRIQEMIYGKAQDTMPLKVVIQVDEAIPVPTQKKGRGEKTLRGQGDPLLCQLEQRLRTMLESLARESPLFAGG